MRSLIIVITFIVVLTNFSNAQKQFDKWFFGRNAALDFSTGSPVALAGSQMDAVEGSASIADSCTGDLLFYTNGITVYDRTHNPMPNGDTLLANSSSTQAAMIIPSVGNANKYYVFTTNTNTAMGYRYSEVDMTLNGSLGDVVVATKNTLLYPRSDEKITATMHSNCRDIWVLNHSRDTFRAYLVTAVGVSPVPIITKVGMNNVPLGAMKFSNFGKKLVLLNYGGMGNKAEIFDFDNSTGVVSNPIAINSVNGPYSASFSPNDSLFYLANRGGVYQFETYNANIPSTQSTIVANASKLFSIQLAPQDCRIYVSDGYGATSLGIINNPNSKTNPNFVSNAVPLQPPLGAIARDGLPNFFIFQPSCTPVPTFKDSVPVCSQTGYFEDTSQAQSCVNVNRIWNFGDPASGIADTSSLKAPSHTFTSIGPYTITLILKKGRCWADTLAKTIVIDSMPTADAGIDTAICKDDSITLYGSGGPSYLWSTGDTIDNTTVSPSVTTTYSLIVSTSINCNDTDYVIVRVDSAIANAGPDTVICYNDLITLTATGGGAYGWSNFASTQSISVSPATTTSYTVTVTVNNCTDTDDLIVTVNPLPTINLGQDQTICMGQDYTFNAGTGYSRYEWQDGNTSQVYPASIEGTYWIIITDANGCSNADTVLLHLIPCDTSELWVPNAFTPNSDGVNDVFEAKGQGVTNFKMYIYNRWGELVFQSDDITEFWNGTYNSSLCIDGVYSWIIFYEGTGKGEQMKAGRVTLMH